MNHLDSKHFFRKLMVLILLMGGALTSQAQGLCPALQTFTYPSNSGIAVSWSNNFSFNYTFEYGIVGQPPLGSQSGLFYSYSVTGLSDCDPYYWTLTANCSDGSSQLVSGTFSVLCDPEDDDPLFSPGPGNDDPNDPTSGWIPVEDPTGGDPGYWVIYLGGNCKKGASNAPTPATLKVGPVPSQGLLEIQLTDADHGELQLIDFNGRTVADLGAVQPGTNRLKHDVQHLPNGIYLLSYTDAQVRVMRKVIIQK